MWKQNLFQVRKGAQDNGATSEETKKTKTGRNGQAGWVGFGKRFSNVEV